MSREREPDDGGGPSMEDAQATVERFIEAATSADPTAAEQLVAEDVVVREPPGLPYGGEYVGREGLRRLHERMAATWERKRGSPDGTRTYFVHGDQVVVAGKVAGRVRGAAHDVEIQVLERYTVNDGMIVEIVPFYFDSSLG